VLVFYRDLKKCNSRAQQHIPLLIHYLRMFCPEGVFLDVIGTINLKTFAPCHSQSPSPADFSPPYGFLGLDISNATAESGWELGFIYIISLFTFESGIALSLITLNFI
jgi:hypothetical protein